MSIKNKTLTYAVAAVVLTAVIAGAAVTYNSSILKAPSQQTNIVYTSQTSQLSANSQAPSSSQGAPTSQVSSASSSSQGTSTQTSSPSSSTSILSGTGALSIYLTDAPPSSPTLKYLLVNVSSVELRYEGNVATTTTTTTTTSPSSSSTSGSSTSSSSTSTTTTSTSATTTTTTATSSSTPQNTYVFSVPSNLGLNVNLTSLHGQSLLLGAINMPAGNITSIVISITGAKAFYTDGSSAQLKVVANGQLMVPIQFAIQANGSTDLTIDITPNLVHISQGDVLTPVIHVTSVEKGSNNSTTTHTTSVDEAQTTTGTTTVSSSTTTTSTTASSTTTATSTTHSTSK